MNIYEEKYKMIASNIKLDKKFSKDIKAAAISKIIYRVTSAIFSVLILIVIFLLRQRISSQSEPNKESIYLLGGTLVISLIGFFVPILIYKLLKKKINLENIEKALSENNWTEIYNMAHQIFFENSNLKVSELKVYSLSYLEEGWSKNNKNNYLVAEYKNAILNFIISSNITSLANKHVTYVEEKLFVSKKGLSFPYGIILKKNKAVKESDFISESIAFNEKILIESENQNDVTKFFTPKVIDKYQKINFERKFKDQNLNVNGIGTTLKWNISGKQKGFEIAKFEAYNNLDKYLVGIARKVVEDLKKLYGVLKYSEPWL